MQKTGRNSIVMNLMISNYQNPHKSYFVKVQANKNLGICNITREVEVPKTIFDQKTKKKKAVGTFSTVQVISAALTKFQGQPINSGLTFERLNNFLTKILNSNEL